jgi:hypothetical protein
VDYAVDAVVPLAPRNELVMSLPQFNEFQNNLGPDAYMGRADADGSIVVEDIADNSVVVFSFRGKDRGFVKYAAASLNSPQVFFSQFPADSPLRRDFEVQTAITEYLQEDSLSAVLRYRVNHGTNQDISTSFEEYVIPQKDIHLVGGSNNGYIDFSSQDINVSLFSTVEYVLRIEATTRSGIELTAENGTSIFKELWNIGEGELKLQDIDL